MPRRVFRRAGRGALEAGGDSFGGHHTAQIASAETGTELARAPHGDGGERAARRHSGASGARQLPRGLPAAPGTAAALGDGGGGGGERAGAAGFPRLWGELVPLPQGAGEPLPAAGAARPAAAGGGSGAGGGERAGEPGVGLA